MKFAICVVVWLELFLQLLADSVPEQHVVPRCTDSDFAVTVGSRFELYVDGTLVAAGLPNAHTWTAADRVRVAASSAVIGIKVVSTGAVAGILASGASSTTDGSWKCTDIFYDGWAGVRFDDSTWPDATVLGSHGDDPWGTIAGINSAAKWIWNLGTLHGDKTVYCRKRRACISEPTNTGPSCITSCSGRVDGDYQSCKGCDVYATCSNGHLFDERPCALDGLVWDDRLKRCEYKSTTCGTTTITSPSCARSCSGRVDGDYQSCRGCTVYATCSNGLLYDHRPCPSGLVWDDRVKRCSKKSTTCRNAV